MKISLITPVYNAERFIPNCVQYVLQQTFIEFEWIIINDGSNDNSRLLLEQYAKQDNRIRVISIENGGAARARNVGLNAANGQYICFLDVDDCIRPEFLQILYEGIISSRCDIVQCAYTKVTVTDYRDNNIKWGRLNDTTVKTLYSNIQMLEQIYTDKAVDTIVIWNKIYKKELFYSLCFPEGIMFEDEVFSAQILYRARKVGMVESVLYYYTQNPQSVMHCKYNIKKLDILKALKLRMEFYKQNGLDELYHKDVFKYIYKILQNYCELSDKDYNELRKKLRKDYWKRYHEGLSFNWSHKRKIAFFIFGIFPSLYKRYYLSKQKS